MSNVNLNDIPDITFDGIAMNHTNDSQPVQEKPAGFDAKNYLNTRLDVTKGEKKKELHIRLLPMDLKTGNPFVIVHQHSAKVPTDVSKSGYKSYICPSKTDIDHEVYGNKCPFCEINQTAFKHSQEENDPLKKKEWTKLSLANLARPAAICRCIDRDNEEDGVKFWKINISRKEDDAYNQILNLVSLRRAEGEKMNQSINILSLKSGYDLVITITEGGENTFGNTITVSDAKFSTPLSNDPERAKAWVYDSKKWTDVFGVKPYDYLSIICAGGSPWYDRATKSWVPKKEFDGAVAQEEQKIDSNIAEAEAQFTQPSQPQSFMDSLEVKLPDNDDNDLPF